MVGDTLPGNLGLVRVQDHLAALELNDAHTKGPHKRKQALEVVKALDRVS
jgi:hypothetical protein